MVVSSGSALAGGVCNLSSEEGRGRGQVAGSSQQAGLHWLTHASRRCPSTRPLPAETGSSLKANNLRVGGGGLCGGQGLSPRAGCTAWEGTGPTLVGPSGQYSAQRPIKPRAMRTPATHRGGTASAPHLPLTPPHSWVTPRLSSSTGSPFPPHPPCCAGGRHHPGQHHPPSGQQGGLGRPGEAQQD